MSQPQLALERHRLGNGLDVVLQPDSSLPLVAINLWYHVGSKNERPGRTGFAHLFEHMLFQGSQHVGTNEHFRYVQQAGGVANGSTWYDRTNYYETLPSRHLDLGLWLESDRMGFLLPAMTQEKLDRQRAVVLNERRQTVDNRPYGRAGERLYELAFPPPHPYGWPVIGRPEDLEAARLEEVAEFFRTYYVPANAVLTLVGEFEPEAALASVERFFGEIPGGAAPATPRPRPPAPTGEVRETLADRVELARVYLAWVVPPFGSDPWYAGDLLAGLLADGKSSPLYRDLVYERQIAQDVGAYVLPTEAASLFMIVATARPGTDPAELEAAIERHLDTATSAAEAEADLERARNRARAEHLEQLQNFDQRADLLGQLTTYFDRPEQIADLMAPYDRLTVAELRRFAERRLRPDRRVVLTVLPENGAA